MIETPVCLGTCPGRFSERCPHSISHTMRSSYLLVTPHTFPAHDLVKIVHVNQFDHSVKSIVMGQKREAAR